MQFLRVVLLVELEVVQVDATNEFVGLLFLLELNILLALGTLTPETHPLGVVLAHQPLNAVDHVGNIETLAVPAREDIAVLNQV